MERMEHDRQRDDEDRPEHAVHPVVAPDRDDRGQDRDRHRHHVCVPAERLLKALRQQHLIGHIERQIGEQHRNQRYEHAAVAELGAGLDHLRQP